jgi:hypothetical protein
VLQGVDRAGAMYDLYVQYYCLQALERLEIHESSSMNNAPVLKKDLVSGEEHTTSGHNFKNSI